jgi:hypothetical protein
MMEKERGKYIIEEPESTPRSREMKDEYGLFNHMLDAVGRDSPEGKVLADSMERYGQEVADKSGRMFKRHYEPSYGIQGYLGDPYYQGQPKLAAKELIRSAEGYIKDGLDWMYSSRTARELNAFHKKAPELGVTNVDTVLRMNWDKLNNVEGQIARSVSMIMEAGPEALGLDRNLLKRLGIDMKREATMFMLGYFRPIFLAAQFIQPHQFVPPMLRLLESRTGVSSNSSVMGLGFAAHGEAYRAITKDFDGPGGVNRKAAMDYLVENRVIDPHFMDTAHDLFQRELSKIGRFARGENAIAFSERYARTNAFFQFDLWLQETHPYMPRKERFASAAELAEGTMTNYRRFERAQIFHDLGFVGDMASGLMTFKINFASQLYRYAKEAIVNHAPKPILTLLAIQMIYSGVMGLPGREEADMLINLMKKAGLNPSFPTVTEFILKNANKLDNPRAGDTVKYGPFSGASGADISPTFGTGGLLPDTNFSSWFPVLNRAGMFLGAAGNVGMALGKQALGQGEGPTRSDWGSLAKQGPTAFQPAVERMMQNPNTGIVPDPTKEMQGGPTRSKDLLSKDWAIRASGLRTTDESTFSHARYETNKMEGAKKERTAALLKEAKELAVDGRNWNSQYQEYLKLGGDPTPFINQVVDANVNLSVDAKTREALRTRTPASIQRYLHMKSMYRE